MIRELAAAKLNLSLEVVGRRPDGYHELATIFQTIGLHDELTFDASDELRLEVDDASLATDENLVLRAARLLAEQIGRHPGARIRLVKRIPIAAGLGGGSADAAAALRGLRRLWGVDVDDRRLIDIAARLGADVPFLLRGGTALASGIGERLEHLPALVGAWAIVYAPPYDVPAKTARAYGGLRADDFSDGTTTRALAAAIGRGEVPDLACAPNAFRRVAGDLFPGIGRHEAMMRDAGARWTRLTGAGPTLFTLADDGAAAERIREGLPSGAAAWAVPIIAG